MAKFKAYEKYVYSDYFKAELPSEWMEKRLNYISAYDRNSFVDGPFGSDLKSSDYKESGVPLIQLNNIRDGKHVLQNYKFITEKKRVELSRHVALPNDIVIAKMAEPVARSAIVSDKYPEYVIVADCVKLSPDLSLINLSFLNWAINSDLVKMNAELVSSGTTRIRISLGELKKLKIPYPSLIEQQAIANFLDHETAQIDTLIEKQQTLIQLLKEKRQGVISHAVTKGLNPDAPMKDSGVEWLGEVPEHWEVSKLKYYSSIQGGYAFSSDSFTEEGVQILKIGNVYQNRLALERQPTFVPEVMLEALPDFIVKDGDILMSLTGTLGKRDYGFAVAIKDDGKYLLNQRVAKLNPADEKIDRDFLLNVLWSESYLNQLYSLPSGTKQANLSNSDVLDIVITLPPSKTEQKEIAVELQNQKDTFDKAIQKAMTSIELMQERRTALISAAVTGKIDVRGWQAPE